jgi:amidohydrolase
MGKVGIFEREGLASADRFTIKIIGQGGHGAFPHLCKDPILAAGQVITQIHSIVSRNVNPLDNAVVSIGKVSGGTAFNIIPDEVELLGTARSLNPQLREELKSRIEQAVQGVVRSYGMDYRFDYEYGYPVLINDPEMSELVACACAQGIGKENVVRSPRVNFFPDWIARSNSFFTTPGPLTPTLITHSGSPYPR